ncbi:nucleotide disphospho-sugar-binding domain-containing protein [Cellulomonas aerilata]|uniref:UDP glycosyltransferase n=1 Tax=Cellulomonas aerilata TaxID=515326 RepID=A0A512D892_9CELL|nr:glycosyltransferase [Cellulomonas aerilata]GEO32693.1 UDP glycosyltransferase [Cellulomonas aerilata]
MDGAQLLMAVVDGGGTVPPAMGVAAELGRRGHRVRVLGDPTVEASARAAGCEFLPWTTAPSFATLAEQTAALGAAEHGSPRARMRVVTRFAGGPAIRAFADDVLAATRAQPTDGVLVEAMLPGLVIGAEASGLPAAGLMANLYVPPTRGLPPMSTGWSPGRTPVGRLRDTAVLGAARLATRGAARPLNRIRAEYGLAPVPDVFAQLDRLSRVLVMSSAAFDFPATLPPNVRYVGPQTDDPDWAGGQDWRPDGDGPLVLVGMSSVYQRQAGVLRTVAQALGSLPVRGVITTGRAVAPDEVPAAADIRVVRSAPHREVLREASVVVTHAGHGTVLKSLAAGVPVVCLPMGRDQRANAARVVRLGAGVRVSPRASADRVAAAVRQVLADPSFASAAARTAQVLASEAATHPSAADEVEAMIGVTPARSR